MNGSLRSPQTQPGDPTPQVSGLRGNLTGVTADTQRLLELIAAHDQAGVLTELTAAQDLP